MQFIFCLHTLFFTKSLLKGLNIINLEKLKLQYKDEDIIHLLNPRQVYFYLENNIHPLWLETGRDNKIVFVFEKKPTLLLFKKWRELDTGWTK